MPEYFLLRVLAGLMPATAMAGATLTITFDMKDPRTVSYACGDG